mmetsp:Transcript_7738/g.18594  ORF Transcript_7738/g.18594 Transcript_7738/m.18594 type:complete len:339 (+) Transcript_7738:230-1246(+)
MRQAPGCYTAERGLESLYPRLGILWNLLLTKMIIQMFPHLFLAFTNVKSILVVHPISHQQLQVPKRCIFAWKVTANSLRERGNVIHVLQLVFLHAVLDVVYQLGRKQSGQAEDSGTLRFGHGIVPSTLCVHQEHGDFSAILIPEDKRRAPKPDTLRALVFAGAPGKAGAGIIQLRTLVDAGRIAFQHPIRGSALLPVILSEPPTIICGCRNRLSLSRQRCHLRRVLSQSVKLHLLQCPFLCKFLCRLFLQIPGQQIKQEALARTIRPHHGNDGNVTGSGLVELRAYLVQIFFKNLHLRRLRLQFQNLDGGIICSFHVSLLQIHTSIWVMLLFGRKDLA